jgi:hypothetical protein
MGTGHLFLLNAVNTTEWPHVPSTGMPTLPRDQVEKGEKGTGDASQGPCSLPAPGTWKGTGREGTKLVTRDHQGRPQFAEKLIFATAIDRSTKDFLVLPQVSTFSTWSKRPCLSSNPGVRPLPGHGLVQATSATV